MTQCCAVGGRVDFWSLLGNLQQLVMGLTGEDDRSNIVDPRDEEQAMKKDSKYPSTI